MSTVSSVNALPAEDWKDLVAELLPAQGSWSDDAYLWLTDQTPRLVELNDGHLEVLPMPTDRHQSILQVLMLAFHQFLGPRGGKVQFAPLRLRIRLGKFREPDLLLVKDAGDPRRQNRFWTGADLVLEVPCPDRPERDLDDKRVDYAAAGVPEYWLVDPELERITVLGLTAGSYRTLGEFSRSRVAASTELAGFSLDVDSVFDVN